MCRNLFIITAFFAFLSCTNESKSGFSPEDQAKIDASFDSMRQNVKEVIRQRENLEPITIAKVNYSFVVVELEKTYMPGRTVIASGIIETEKTLSEDERYYIIDQTTSDLTRFETGSVVNRYMKSYDTYAEASKAREKALNIDNYDRNEKTKVDDIPDATDVARSATEEARE